MLPTFKITSKAARWIENEQTTSKAIRLLWKYASASDHSDPEFLLLLMRCAWVNGDEGATDASRQLRNSHLVAWLELPETVSDSDLIKAMTEQIGMPASSARWFVHTEFGITHYYKAFRGHLSRHVFRHKLEIAKAFKEVARYKKDPAKKAYDVARRILALPRFNVATGKSSIMNGVSPALACLDPQSRFPILNQRTKRLLAALGQNADAEGVRALSGLVGRWGLKTAFHVDVYSQVYGTKFKPVRRTTTRPSGFSDLGIKSEEKSIASYDKRKVVIRKRHIALLNKLATALTPPFHVQYNRAFDAVVHDYRKGRKLLIEAKTETSGVLGRMQLRQAIGQLLDYRWREFSNIRDKVDLAILTPTAPPDDMLNLLDELDIAALWFDGRSLTGTIALVDP